MIVITFKMYTDVGAKYLGHLTIEKKNQLLACNLFKRLYWDTSDFRIVWEVLSRLWVGMFQTWQPWWWELTDT